MFNIMTALHLVTAIFLIGPLAHAATTAGRALRTADAPAVTHAARTTTIYAYASIVVVVFGFGLMSATSPYTGEPVATFAETWIWLSALLWLIGLVFALAITAPALKHAATRITAGEPVGSARARYAASGGLVALIFIVVTVLMVYQPGS